MHLDSISTGLTCSCLVQQILGILSPLSWWRRRLSIYLWNRSSILFQANLNCKITFKGGQILRVDILGCNNKFFHLGTNITLNLELLDILSVSINGILFEKVSHKYIFDVRSLVTESRHWYLTINRWMSTTSVIPLPVWFTKRKSLCNVHFLEI